MDGPSLRAGLRRGGEGANGPESAAAAGVGVGVEANLSAHSPTRDSWMSLGDVPGPGVEYPGCTMVPSLAFYELSILRRT